MALEEAELARPRATKEGGSGCLYWALGCAGVGLLTCILCCGGLGYLTTNIMSTEVELKLRDNPQIREHLGELSSVRVNLLKSLTHHDGELWVYDLSGAKGKGELTAKQSQEIGGDGAFESATLRLSDGTTVEIHLKSDADEPEPPVEVPPVSAPVMTEPQKDETSPIP